MNIARKENSKQRVDRGSHGGCRSLFIQAYDGDGVFRFLCPVEFDTGDLDLHFDQTNAVPKPTHALHLGH